MSSVRRCLLLVAVLAAALAASEAASSEATPETARAVLTVREAVAYTEQTIARSPAPAIPAYLRSAGYLASVAAMDYTLGHVVAPAYGYLNEIRGAGQPDASPESILTAQAGICGHAEIVMREILAELGYTTRGVGFLAGGSGHITVEVLYDGAWHWFDPTFGVYYRKAGNVLPIEAVRSLAKPAAFAITDGGLLWRQVVAGIGAGMTSGMALPLSSAPISYQP